MNDRELRLFNLWAIRTKDELLGAIDEYIDRIEQHDDIEIVRKGRSKPLVDVMKDFRKKVARKLLSLISTRISVLMRLRLQIRKSSSALMRSKT